MTPGSRRRSKASTSVPSVRTATAAFSAGVAPTSIGLAGSSGPAAPTCPNSRIGLLESEPTRTYASAAAEPLVFDVISNELTDVPPPDPTENALPRGTPAAL
jgi:hypothetical protein